MAGRGTIGILVIEAMTVAVAAGVPALVIRALRDSR